VVVDPVRVSAQLVVRALEAGTAPVRELARLGSDSLTCMRECGEFLDDG